MTEFNPKIFGRKLKALRNQTDLDQTEFVATLSLDVKQAAYSSWELGNSLPNLPTIKKIADYFKVSIDWLLEPANDFSYEPKYSNLDSLVAEELIPYHFKHVPIISKVQAGDPRLIYREDNIDGRAVLPAGTVADYAMIVVGDSMYNPDMSNSIAPGDTVFCSLTETPLLGDVVVVLTTEGRQMLKQLFKYVSDDKIEIRSFNSTYPSLFLHPDQIEVMHRVVYHQPAGKNL